VLLIVLKERYRGLTQVTYSHLKNLSFNRLSRLLSKLFSKFKLCKGSYYKILKITQAKP